MTKFHFTAIALLMAASGASARDLSADVSRYSAAARHSISTEKTNFSSLSASKYAAPALAAEESSETAITNPEGESTSYIREAYSWYEMMGSPYPSWTDDFVSDVVINGNEVYLQNPVFELPLGSYIKGTLDGDKITFQFPQYLGDYKGVPAYVNRFVMEWTNKEEQKVMYFIAPEEDNKVVMTIADDGTITMEESYEFDTEVNYPDFILGINSTGGDWTGYGEFNSIYTKNKYIAETRPAGVTFENYQMRFNDYAGQYVLLGIDGDKVYLSDLSGDFPNAVVTGTLKDNQITFPSLQYLGVDSEWNGNTFFWTFKMEWGYDEYYGYEGWLTVPTAAIVMDYDPANKTLSSKECFCFNLGDTDMCYTQLFKNPVISPRPAEFKAAAPENPRIDQVDPYNSDPNYCYSRVAFTLPMFNVENCLMDLDKLYYNVYFGDEIYLFEPWAFINLKEPMTDVPYLFTDTEEYGGYEIKVYDKIYHYIYFDNLPDIPTDKFGVQLIYKDTDGTLYKSDIVYNPFTSVETLPEMPQQPVATLYTDLAGKNVASPERGLFIKTTVNADGSRKSEKVIIK